MKRGTLSIDDEGVRAGMRYMAVNPQYLLHPMSFIHKEENVLAKKYEVILQFKLKAGTIKNIEKGSVKDRGTKAKVLKKLNVPTRKREGKEYAPTINYGFYTQETVTKFLPKGTAVINIQPIWIRRSQ